MRALRHVMKQVKRGVYYCLPPIPRAQYIAVSTRPVVLVVQDYSVLHPRDAFLDLMRHLRDYSPHVYYNTSWYVRPGHLDHHLTAIRRLERTCPGVRITVLGQTGAETELFMARGVDAIFCNQNALADERVFRPLPGVERRFAAIYDAKLQPFKRHALARQIPSLALMGYQNPGTADPRYSAATIRELAHAHWFFDPARSPDQWEMTDEDVNAAYNQCRIGLCLSSEEGAMWASIQYLLAGMSVVSTPSKGGRDEFFEAPYVRIAEPTSEAVAAAVDHQVAMRHDPETIRRRTLERMAGHRARFLAHVQTRFTAAGESRRFAEEWRQVIPHRLIDMRLVGRGKKGAIAEHNRRIVASAERGEPYPLVGRPVVCQSKRDLD